MAAKPDRKPSEEKPPKRGKGILIGSVAAILIAASVGAGWYFTRPAALDDEAPVALKQTDAIFVNLEPFTVNLADEGGERLAQIAVVLELANASGQGALSKNLPIVRNGILLLLSSQHTKTLLTLEGKLALADEIAIRTGAALGWHPEVDEDADDEEAQPVQPRKVTSRKPRSRPKRAALPNPVVAVHFSQLLIQ